jgi:hypothetical protein
MLNISEGDVVMKRSGSIFAILGLIMLLVLVAVAIPVEADDHIPPHPHMLLQKVEIVFDENGPHLAGFKRCVDLASNQALPLNAHHEHIHTGTTGISFGGDFESGHVVFPGAPLTEIANCGELVELISGD